jgi:vitamin B12 transporter
VKLALRYDDRIFRGLLTGRHVWWNSDPTFSGSYNGLLWDLFLGAKLVQRDPYAVELFFSGHNLFDTLQHPDPFPVNTGRWFEGGVRVRF